MKAKIIVYAKQFDGPPKRSDFEVLDEDLPDNLQDGEILCEAEYISVDPYIRSFITHTPIGSVIIGTQVAKIIASKNENYPKDEYVVGQFGWRTHTITTPRTKNVRYFGPESCYLLPSFGKLSRSLGVGALGMPGVTALYGFFDVCKPKENDVVVISGAAGAVGTLVGQIAKLKGCTVIGFAGTKDKCDWIKNDLGFDHAINYKKCNLAEALKKVAPDGVDVYFDNTGGEISATVIDQMRQFGRIGVCGAISSYNSPKEDWPQVPHVFLKLLNDQIRMEGIVCTRWNDSWLDGIEQLKKWIEEGKLKYKETFTYGFENTPIAFIEMLAGKNYGKAVVQI